MVKFFLAIQMVLLACGMLVKLKLPAKFEPQDSRNGVGLLATGRVVKQSNKLHDGPIFCLCPNKDGKLLSGGGKDRKLIEWDDELNPSRTAEVLNKSQHIICQNYN